MSSSSRSTRHAAAGGSGGSLRFGSSADSGTRYCLPTRTCGSSPLWMTASMTPGEQLFYQRCTVCHGPRDPAAFTQMQWKSVTQTMFPRAGLEPQEQELVLDFLMKNAADAK